MLWIGSSPIIHCNFQSPLRKTDIHSVNLVADDKRISIPLLSWSTIATTQCHCESLHFRKGTQKSTMLDLNVGSFGAAKTDYQDLYRTPQKTLSKMNWQVAKTKTIVWLQKKSSFLSIFIRVNSDIIVYPLHFHFFKPLVPSASPPLSCCLSHPTKYTYNKSQMFGDRLNLLRIIIGLYSIYSTEL